MVNYKIFCNKAHNWDGISKHQQLDTSVFTLRVKSIETPQNEISRLISHKLL